MIKQYCGIIVRVREGERPPALYRPIYHDFFRKHDVSAPLGLNLVFRMVINLWVKSYRFRLNSLEMKAAEIDRKYRERIECLERANFRLRVQYGEHQQEIKSLRDKETIDILRKVVNLNQDNDLTME